MRLRAMGERRQLGATRCAAFQHHGQHVTLTQAPVPKEEEEKKTSADMREGILVQPVFLGCGHLYYW